MKRTIRILTAVGLLLWAGDALFVDPHGEEFRQTFPGFDFVYGALGCAVIVWVSKALGKAGIQRDEE